MSINQHPMASDDDLRTTLTIPAGLVKSVDKRLDEAKQRQEVPDSLHRNQFLILLIKRGLATPSSNPPKTRKRQ